MRGTVLACKSKAWGHRLVPEYMCLDPHDRVTFKPPIECSEDGPTRVRFFYGGKRATVNAN